MTKIEFNEPSNGVVSSNGSPALTIVRHGKDAWGVKAVCFPTENTVGVQGITGGIRSWGVWGESQSDREGIGVVGLVNGGANKVGVLGKCTGQGGLAGRFEGDVEVTGDIRLLNADCAEDFDVSTTNGDQTIEPGTVVVLNDVGNLEPSCQAYDKKVAGVISGAGGYKPGIVLDKQQQQQESEDDTDKRRMPIALMGKVYCKVDATTSPVEVGDLLTTSSREGHAMKASDPLKAFGTVIGKALKPLKEGRGMIPVLVALQ